MFTKTPRSPVTSLLVGFTNILYPQLVFAAGKLDWIRAAGVCYSWILCWVFFFFLPSSWNSLQKNNLYPISFASNMTLWGQWRHQGILHQCRVDIKVLSLTVDSQQRRDAWACVGNVFKGGYEKCQIVCCQHSKDTARAHSRQPDAPYSSI